MSQRAEKVKPTTAPSPVLNVVTIAPVNVAREAANVAATAIIMSKSMMKRATQSKTPGVIVNAPRLRKPNTVVAVEEAVEANSEEESAVAVANSAEESVVAVVNSVEATAAVEENSVEENVAAEVGTLVTKQIGSRLVSLKTKMFAAPMRRLSI